jgi:hypothetical protein
VGEEGDQHQSILGLLTSNELNEEILHTEAVKDLMTELSHVRKQVFRETLWFQRTESANKWPREWLVLVKRRRLLLLFMKDLATGVSGEALATKSERDCSVGSSKARAMLEGESWKRQLVAWLFVILMNGGLLFYVYLFAMSQTHSRQSAWFRSFVMWLLFEVTVSSTGLVVLTHLLIPLYVLADVSRIKEKVLQDLLAFRKNCLGRDGDIEEGRGGPEAMSGPQDERAINTVIGFGAETKGTHDANIGSISTKGTVEGAEVTNKFNAAKYLFPSWRVASIVPELPESGVILQFNTPWPKRKFGEKGAAVSTEYEQAVVLTTLSRIVVYFLGSLLRFHTLVQDILLQTVCNSGLGVLGVCLIRLFAIHPALPVALGVGLLLVLRWLLMVATGSSKGNEGLSSVAPERTDPSPPPSTPIDPPLSGGEDHPPANSAEQPPTPLPSQPPLALTSRLSEEEAVAVTGGDAASELSSQGVGQEGVQEEHRTGSELEGSRDQQPQFHSLDDREGEGCSESLSDDSDDMRVKQSIRASFILFGEESD